MDKKTIQRIRQEVDQAAPNIETLHGPDQMDSRAKWGNRKLPKVRNTLRAIQPQLDAIRDRALQMNEGKELHLRDTILMRLEYVNLANNTTQLDRALKALENLLGVAAEMHVVALHEAKKDVSTKEAAIEAMRQFLGKDGES